VHPEVGDLIIADAGDEIIVYVGNFTFVHFDEWADELSEQERANRVADRVLKFLDDIFAERMLFFGSLEGAGGCRLRGSKPSSVGAELEAAMLSAGKRRYVWSGPTED